MVYFWSRGHGGFLLLLVLSWSVCGGRGVKVEVEERSHDSSVGEGEEDEEERLFRGCYVDTKVFFKNTLGSVRECIAREVPPISVHFCKNVVDCVEEAIEDEEPISKTGVELLGEDERMWGVEDGRTHFHPLELTYVVRNIFVFLFQAGCYQYPSPQFTESLAYFAYWFFQQIEMQRCWKLRGKKSFSEKIFKQWEKRMKLHGRHENEMDFITEYLLYRDVISRPWTPPPHVHAILYHKILYGAAGTPIGAATYALVFDREAREGLKGEKRRKYPKLGFYPVAQQFECWSIEEEDEEECAMWERQVAKKFVARKARIDAERILFEGLLRLIPKKRDDPVEVEDDETPDLESIDNEIDAINKDLDEVNQRPHSIDEL